jgi:hypothetical protein
MHRSVRLWSSTKIGRPALEWPPFRRCSRGLGRDLVVVNTAEQAEDELMGNARGDHHLVCRTALRAQASQAQNAASAGGFASMMGSQ